MDIYIYSYNIGSFIPYVYTPGLSRNDYFPDRFLTGLHRFPAPRSCSLSPGFSRNVGITLTGLQPRLPGSPMVKSHIYIYIYICSCRVLRDLGIAPTGLLTGLLKLARNALLFQRIHQNAPLLQISHFHR